jgi:hypothetical protein
MSSLRGPGGIFISYRREETAANAGRLYDRLSDHFGEDRVFMDVDSLAYGVDFTRAVIDAVSRCDVLLALIGRDWLAITDNKGRRRLDNPNDWVRVEIETALQRDIRVVPVLVDGAVLPQADDLPPSLRPLTQRQQLELSHRGFKLEVTSLIAAVDKVLTADPVGHQPQSAAEQREAEQTAARQQEERSSKDSALGGSGLSIGSVEADVVSMITGGNIGSVSIEYGPVRGRRRSGDADGG